MSRKMDHLCLDKCDVQPKLILDIKVMALHSNHNYQSIETIYQRLKEPDYVKIINEFLEECSLDSLLSQNEILKQKILKIFALNVTQLFDEIASIQASNFGENTRIEKVLRSINPDYNQDLLLQIQGDFAFLKEEQLGELHTLAKKQKERNITARNEIDLLMSEAEKLFIRKKIQAPQKQEMAQVQKPIIKHDIKIIQEETKNQSHQKYSKKIIQWEQDSKQEERFKKISTSKKKVDYIFAKDRQLQIQGEGKSLSDISLYINHCIEFKPTSLNIILWYYLF